MSDNRGGWSTRNPTLSKKLYYQVFLKLQQKGARSEELKKTNVDSRYLSLFKRYDSLKVYTMKEKLHLPEVVSYER